VLVLSQQLFDDREAVTVSTGYISACTSTDNVQTAHTSECICKCISN